MKTVQSFPACDIIDLEQDIIVVTVEDTDHFTGRRFCVEKESRRHGMLYPEVSPGCVVYYAQKNGDDVEANVARAEQHGHPMYWLSNCGASIVGHNRPRWELILLTPGQKLELNGVVLEVVKRGFEHYDLKPVAA